MEKRKKKQLLDNIEKRIPKGLYLKCYKNDNEVNLSEVVEIIDIADLDYMISYANKPGGSAEKLFKNDIRIELFSDFYIIYNGIKYNSEYLKRILKSIELKNPSNFKQIEFDPFAEISNKEKKEIFKYKEKMAASRWKSRQRSLRKKGKLDQYKIDSLNKLGMLWNPKDDEWEKNYLSFKNKGFCYELKEWISEQRELYKSNEIFIENLERLKAINFPFIEGTNEKYPFTYDSYYSLWFKFTEETDKIIKACKVVNNQELQIKESQKQINDYYYNFHSEKDDFKSKLYNLSYDESILLIDRVIQGKSIFYETIKSYAKNMIHKNNWKIKLGNPAYADLELLKEKMSHFDIYIELTYFNKSKFNPNVRKYACEKMIDFFEIISKKKDYNNIKNFAPVKYLISYHKKRKEIDDLIILKKNIKKYPLLLELYNNEIEKIITKL